MKKIVITLICSGSMLFSINSFAVLTQNTLVANGVQLNGVQLNGIAFNGLTTTVSL